MNSETELSQPHISVQVVKRPTMLGIFLSFSLILIGMWMILNSVMRMVSKDEGGLSQLIEYKLGTLSGDEDDPKHKKKMEDLHAKFQNEFAPEQLIKETGRSNLFRRRKVHHVAAVVFGGLSILIGLLSASANYLAWRRAWSSVRSYSPDQRVVCRPNLASAMVGWWTFVFGMGLTIPSVMALQKLYDYKTQRWLDGMMNMGTMVHLAEHYQSLLVLGIILLLAGMITILVHWTAFRRVMRIVEKAASVDILEEKVVPETPFLPWGEDETDTFSHDEADNDPSLPEEDRW